MSLFALDDPVPDALELDFARWWSEYPKKRERMDAFKAYRAACKVHSPAQLLAARDAYLAEITAEATDPRYIVYPAGFLRRKVEDYLPSAPRREKVKPVCPKHGLESCRFYSGSGWVCA